MEGWKTSNIKKIEVYRSVLKKPLLYKLDNSFIAIATNEKNFTPNRRINVLDLDNAEEIADFIINFKFD